MKSSGALFAAAGLTAISYASAGISNHYSPFYMPCLRRV